MVPRTTVALNHQSTVGIHFVVVRCDLRWREREREKRQKRDSACVRSWKSASLFTAAQWNNLYIRRNSPAAWKRLSWRIFTRGGTTAGEHLPCLEGKKNNFPTQLEKIVTCFMFILWATTTGYSSFCYCLLPPVLLYVSHMSLVYPGIFTCPCCFVSHDHTACQVYLKLNHLAAPMSFFFDGCLSVLPLLPLFATSPLPRGPCLSIKLSSPSFPQVTHLTPTFTSSPVSHSPVALCIYTSPLWPESDSVPLPWPIVVVDSLLPLLGLEITCQHLAYY